jgi:urease accessory protein
LNARLALRFELAGRHTQMRVDTQEPPLRVVRAFPQESGAALVHLHNVSGGILAGDHLSLQIDVGPGAIAQITSTGATRLHRHCTGAPASEQNVSLNVSEDGLLEYLPDAVIPYAGSRYVQRTSVCLANRATFFWWEVLAPGRQASGEEFLFERIRLETSLRSCTGPLLLENFMLEPLGRPLRSAARFGKYTHTASFVACQVGLPATKLRQLEQALTDVARACSLPGVTIWGASALASDGVVVRGLSATARDLPATLARFWNIARIFLTGEKAVLPRKMK